MPGAAPRSPCRAPPSIAASRSRCVQSSSLADAGAARARAHDPRRRPRGGRQAQRGDHRRAPRRLARPGARGVSRARGIGPRAPREEPRRVRAPDQPSRKPTRSTSCAPCSTNSSGAASRRRASAARGARAARAASSAWTRAAARNDVDGYHAAEPRVPRPRWSSSPATASCSRPTGGWSTSCTCSPRDARAGRRPAGVDARASRHRRPDRRRRRRGAPDARCTSTSWPAASACTRRAPPARRHSPTPEARRSAKRRMNMNPQSSNVNGRSYRWPDAPARRRLRRRLRARLHQPGDRGGRRAVPRGARTSAAPASPPTASCPPSPIPNNLSIVTGAPPAVHGICGNYFCDRGRQRRSDDERRASTCAPAPSSRRSPTPAPRSPWSPPRTSCARCSATSMKGICFSAEKADQVTLAEQRHRRRAGARRHAAAVGLQRGAVRVRVRRRRAR